MTCVNEFFRPEYHLSIFIQIKSLLKKRNIRRKKETKYKCTYLFEQNNKKSPLIHLTKFLNKLSIMFMTILLCKMKPKKSIVLFMLILVFSSLPLSSPLSILQNLCILYKSFLSISKQHIVRFVHVNFHRIFFFLI